MTIGEVHTIIGGVERCLCTVDSDGYPSGLGVEEIWRVSVWIADHGLEETKQEYSKYNCRSYRNYADWVYIIDFDRMEFIVSGKDRTVPPRSISDFVNTPDGYREMSRILESAGNKIPNDESRKSKFECSFIPRRCRDGKREIDTSRPSFSISIFDYTVNGAAFQLFTFASGKTTLDRDRDSFKVQYEEKRMWEFNAIECKSMGGIVE